jgi:acyl-CoA thioesterase
MQEDPPQQRFASILDQRPRKEWLPYPPIDVDAIVAMVGEDQVGAFPAVEMKKVDMKAFNEGKPVHERVELILYRLLKPLPSDGTEGWDVNSHAAVHAFTIDRNGLLLMGNHIGFGWCMDKVASLSYTLVFHGNPEEVVMGHGEDDWWIQEARFPRAGAGRGIIESKIWSPAGVHVATEYQDGVITGFGDALAVQEKGKL